MNHLHTSKNYEDELENLRTRVLTMGGASNLKCAKPCSRTAKATRKWLNR